MPVPGNASGLGDVDKCAVALIAKQLIGGAKISHKDVKKAIVIDITDRDSHAIPMGTEP